MSKKMENKIVLISGGTGGMGKASAFLFAEEGGTIVIAGHSDEKGQALIEEFEAKGFKTDFVHCDVVNENESKAAVDFTIGKYGRIDVYLHWTGVGIPDHELWNTATDQWLKVINTNVNGVYYMLKYVCPHMIEQKNGAIMLCSSTNGLKSVPNGDAYSASKGAVSNLIRPMASEMGRYGVRINAVCPGPCVTPMLASAGMANWEDMKNQPVAEALGYTNNLWPIDRFGLPEEMAAAALFLCSDDASYITGINLPVDGGFSVI